jgi:hypothetical protein
MMARLIAALGLVALGLAPAAALEEPVVWRDAETGCAYLLSPQGGIAPRLKRDGAPDCPDANAGSRLVDDTVRGLGQGLDALRREVERLRERFRTPERPGDPL